MKLEDRYRLLKIQGIVTLLCLIAFTFWSAFQDDVWLYFAIICVVGMIQLYIFIKHWQPTLKEYLEYKKQQKINVKLEDMGVGESIKKLGFTTKDFLELTDAYFCLISFAKKYSKKQLNDAYDLIVKIMKG